MLKIKITKAEKAEYKAYLFSKGIFNAISTFFTHIFYILEDYKTLSKEERKKVFIRIYYNAVDLPVLILDSE